MINTAIITEAASDWYDLASVPDLVRYKLQVKGWNVES